MISPAERIFAAIAVFTAMASTAVGTSAGARADVIAYLVNVTVRPGYDFPNADAAVAYGRAICAKVETGRPYGAMINDVMSDFSTHDEYQASYLISQAVGELCPAQIWQLRQSVSLHASEVS